MDEWEGNLVGHIVMDDLARSRSVRTSITTAGYYSTVTGTVHLKVDGANNEERFRSLIRSSVFCLSCLSISLPVTSDSSAGRPH